MTTIEKKDLGKIEELNSGGEGVVYKILSDEGSVFKEFKEEVRHELNPTSLKDLIELPKSMIAMDRAFLLEHTVWPQAIVNQKSKFVGFTMPIIHDTFFVTHGVRAYPGHTDCDWNKLIMRKTWVNNPNVVSTVPQLDGIPLLDLLIDLAETYSFLHRHKIIVGDISGRNMVWRARPNPRVVLLDNDGFRVNGVDGVVHPKQTPDWVDPYLNGADTTFESDQYKIGLAMLRGYFGLGVLTPNSKEISGCSDPVGKDIIQLTQRSTDQNNRPNAEDWVQLLRRHRRLMSLAGRPVIALEKPTIGVPGNRVTSLIAKRPTIRLQ